jgi:hypothetical protein
MLSIINLLSTRHVVESIVSLVSILESILGFSSLVFEQVFILLSNSNFERCLFKGLDKKSYVYIPN